MLTATLKLVLIHACISEGSKLELCSQLRLCG